MNLAPARTLALIGAASLASCGIARDFSDPHVIRITLPEIPASWAFLPELRAALSWRASGGALRSMSARLGQTVEIEVERGYPQALLALPSSDGRPLLPAGALYPEALAGAAPRDRRDADEIRLDWLGGYVASIALALEREGLDPRSFDLGRLSREAFSRSSDPWALPAREAARRLAEGVFRADALDDPDRRAIALPGEGPWAPESPFAEVPRMRSGPPARLEADLPLGLWRFVGAEDELLVSIEEDGSSAWVIRPRRGHT